MKLIKQIQLFVQEGSSDKVYEIDLCETPSGEYLVNFRYGRRGGPLKDGTKTVFPVSLAEAEKTFATLEHEKRKKGYAPLGEVTIQEDFTREAPKKGEKRRKVIMKALRQATEGEEHETWPLSRIIWRAGELKFIEAEPLILKLADFSDHFNVYACVWALARTGSHKAIPFLEKVKDTATLPEHIRNLAVDVLLILGNEELQNKLIQNEKLTLPNQIQQQLNDQQYDALNETIKEYLLKLKTSSNKYIVSLYRLSWNDEALKQILLEALSELEAKPGTFKYLRQIFKTATMKDDFDIYGVLAKKFEKSPAGYRSGGYGWVYGPEGYVEPEKELKKENPSIAFSDKTKAYLSRKVVRDLERKGTDATEYTALASSILLAFDDEQDKKEPYAETHYEYVSNASGRGGRYENRAIHYDSYANHLAFNYILYKHSTRYQSQSKARWSCVGGYQPGQPAPKGREEAFSALWNEDPKNIVRLLANSRVERVHEFAIKVFNANPKFVEVIEIEHVIKFLKATFKPTSELGHALAIQKYNSTEPHKGLVIAMLESPHAEAVEAAKKWLQASKEVFLSDESFVCSLILSNVEGTRLWAREWLMLNTLTANVAEKVLSTSLSMLLTHKDLNTNEAFINSVTDTLILSLPEWVKRIHLETILLFISHNNTNLHLVGARLLLQNQSPVEEISESVLLSLIQSDKDTVRAVGLELIGKLPLQKLNQKKNLLISLLLSPLGDLRNNVRPILVKLAQQDPAFAVELAELLVPSLLMPEAYEGIHQDIVAFLTSEEVLPQLKYLDKTRVFALCKSRSSSAQTLGIKLVKQNIPPQELSMEEIVKLAGNALLESRTYAWSLYESQKELVKKEKEEAIKITDSYWEDSRKFGFDFFRAQFATEDWTPQLFMGLCDSVKIDVQAYGREMITKCFESQHGEYYLQSLSQHPDTQMQLFASNYLESYASGKPELIQSLELYFITLLSQVNKARTAKTRAMEFLRKESESNESVAKTAASIINRVSASISIQDKAKCIQLLMDLKKKYPQLDNLVKIHQVPDYQPN